MSFLFSWISSKFPCYLLKYCVSHELLSRLRHGSLCCCPLVGCRKLVDPTFVLLTVCLILILCYHQLKKAAQPKFTPSNFGHWQCTQAPYKTPGRGSEEEGGRKEGRRGRERSAPAISESLWRSFSLYCLQQEPKAGRYFTQVGEGKGIWTSSKQLSLKT